MLFSQAKNLSDGFAYLELVVGTSVLLTLAFGGFSVIDWVQKQEILNQSVESALQEVHVKPLSISSGIDSVLKIDDSSLEAEVEKVARILFDDLVQEFPDIKRSKIFVSVIQRTALMDPVTGYFMGFAPTEQFASIGSPLKNFLELSEEEFRKKAIHASIPLPTNGGVEHYLETSILFGIYAAVNIENSPAAYTAQVMNVSSIFEVLKIIDLRGGLV